MEANDIFTALFYGDGSWFGLLILIMLMVLIASRVKWVGAIILPVSVFMFVTYADHNLPWHGIIILITGIYSLIATITKAKD